MALERWSDQGARRRKPAFPSSLLLPAQPSALCVCSWFNTSCYANGWVCTPRTGDTQQEPLFPPPPGLLAGHGLVTFQDLPGSWWAQVTRKRVWEPGLRRKKGGRQTNCSSCFVSPGWLVSWVLRRSFLGLPHLPPLGPSPRLPSGVCFVSYL